MLERYDIWMFDVCFRWYNCAVRALKKKNVNDALLFPETDQIISLVFTVINVIFFPEEYCNLLYLHPHHTYFIVAFVFFKDRRSV